jgi:hypothetical protein
MVGIPSSRTGGSTNPQNLPPWSLCSGHVRSTIAWCRDAQGWSSVWPVPCHPLSSSPTLTPRGEEGTRCPPRTWNWSSALFNTRFVSSCSLFASIPWGPASVEQVCRAWSWWRWSPLYGSHGCIHLCLHYGGIFSGCQIEAMVTMIESREIWFVTVISKSVNHRRI